MKVIFGDMEFGEFSLENGIAPEPMCVIHKIEAVMDMPNEEAADALLGQYDSYVIPSLSKHTIVYTPGAWSAITKKGNDE